MQEKANNSLIPIINNNVIITSRDNEYIITLKESNHHLKISEKMHNLLKLVDNKKNISHIVKDYNSLYQDKITNMIVHELLYNKLGYYDIIDDGKIGFDFNKQPSYLKLNFIIINENLVKKLSKPFLFLFSRPTLKTTLLVSAIITSLTIVFNFNLIITNLKDISIEFFSLYIAIMIISGFFHELGHTSAMYKFAGENGGIGVGFYLFTPVLYANVSGAWKLNTTNRIIVNLGGIYFELIFSTLLIIISFITDYKGLLIVPSIIFIKTLFNLNPFFRTDGYWVLSDYIKTPNFRTTSNNLLYSLFKNKQKLKRKDYFLIIYALISNSFILVFLFILFIQNPNSLISFPIDIYTYISSNINDNIELSYKSIKPLFLPLFFYVLLFRFIISYYKKRSNRKKINYE